MKFEDNVAVDITAHLNSKRKKLTFWWKWKIIARKFGFRAILQVIYQQKHKKTLLIYKKIFH